MWCCWGDRTLMDEERWWERWKKNEWQAISLQNPKLVINFGRKCPKTYPKLIEVQGPEVLMPGNLRLQWNTSGPDGLEKVGANNILCDHLEVGFTAKWPKKVSFDIKQLRWWSFGQRTNQDKMTTPYGFSTKSEMITTSVALCQKIPFSVILQWSQLQGDHIILPYLAPFATINHGARARGSFNDTYLRCHSAIYGRYICTYITHHHHLSSSSVLSPSSSCA
jgi:hypothetical protein